MNVSSHADSHTATHSNSRCVTCSIEINTSPAILYATWADVEHWHVWDPDTRSAYLDSPFATGSRGRIIPRKGFALGMVVTEAVPDQRFTVVCRVLGSAMHFEHFLQEIPGGVRATHRVNFQGWLAPLLMRTVGADVAKGLPVTMARLKALCESKQRLR